jgi:DNA-binding MarR family transcriptional regulator
MGSAVWLFLYFLTYANRTTGILFRKRTTIARDLGISPRTINRWIATLKQKGYIATKQSERSLIISISKWKPIVKTR